MSRQIRTAVVGAAALVLGAGGSLAGAATTDHAPEVVNREVVQAELDPSGKLDVARLFSQLSVTGKGTVDVADPTSSKGLRNLDGFGTPKVQDGKALYTIKVDGSTSRRTVSDFTKALPVTVSVQYSLNGKLVQAKDIVGESGLVEASYTVTNVTGTPTEITYKDGKGISQTETVDLVLPLVGQIQTTLPGSFTDLSTPHADVAGDGHGGSLVTYTMVLFEPISARSQTFGWSAQVKDGRVPPVILQILPVAPSQKAELNTGLVDYREGAAKASELTLGAGQIDANLLKLQQGAGELLSGLTQLAAGAVELRDGLTDQIAPGAAELADGAQDAKAGTAKLSTGLGDLSDGADQLSGGLTTADAGAGDLADGIDQILAGVEALPETLAADPDYQTLLGALSAVKAGIGTASDVTPTTLLGGLNLLTYGLRSPLGVTGCDQTAAPGSATACGAADAVELVQEKLAAAAAAGGPIDQLVAAAAGAYALSGCTVPPPGTTPVAGVLPPSSLTPGTVCWLISNVAYGLGLPAAYDPAGLGGLKPQTATAATVLQSVFAGVDASIIPGIGQVKAGLSNPACDLTDPTDPANPCGIYQVQTLVAGGIGQLVDAISAELSDVLTQASEGADELSAGMDLLAAGGVQLADGALEAVDGAGQLDDGLGKIASGAGQLSDGLEEAASGSEQLADGLTKAKGGDQQLVDGAGRLRAEGTSKLVEGGNETAAENAAKYATLAAMESMVADGALPYGAPEGATGSVAYQLDLAGANTAGTDNRNRALAGLALLGLACAVSWTLRRRRLTS